MNISGEKEMSDTNQLLIKLAKSIKKENSDLYNLHFLYIITFLQKEFAETLVEVFIDYSL